MRVRSGRQAVTFANPWTPISLAGGAVAVGLLLGILVGLKTCTPSSTLGGAKQESYLVLAATLYGQGESLSAMKTYLNSFGPGDPSTAMLQLADKYDGTGDQVKKQQAQDLRQLGEALSLGREPEVLATPAANTAGYAVVAATLVTPTVTASTPTPSAPKPASNVQTTSAPAPTPTTSAPPPALTGQAVARPSGGNGAIMRDQPSTKGAMIGSLSNGTNVDILRVVQGEAVDSAENRWYLVKVGNKTGYIYFKLLAAN